MKQVLNSSSKPQKMLLRKSILFLMFSLLTFLYNCRDFRQKQSSDTSENLTVLVAASLTDVITTLADSAEKDLGIELKLNIASSGTLARQITREIPCDIYISASKRWMDYIEERGYTIPESHCIPAQNTLVLITPKGKELKTPFNLTDLPQYTGTRLSIGDPAHVPAGKYAAEALESLKILHLLSDKILPVKDVRSALMIVELGEADFGIVYKTDALRSSKVSTVQTFPDSLHQSISYHAAVLKSSPKKKKAQKTLDYLMNEKSKKTWSGFGFSGMD